MVDQCKSFTDDGIRIESWVQKKKHRDILMMSESEEGRDSRCRLVFPVFFLVYLRVQLAKTRQVRQPIEETYIRSDVDEEKNADRRCLLGWGLDYIFFWWGWSNPTSSLARAVNEA